MVTRPHVESDASRVEKRSTLATTIFVLLFVAWVGEWSLELDAVLYSGLWRSPFVALSFLFEPVPGIRLFTWQLLLIGLTPFCLAAAGAFQSRSRELDRAILVSLACVALTFTWGWLKAGIPYYAYFQVWRWLTALLIALLLVSVVRSPRDFATLGKLIVLAALIRATLCIYFYWAHIRPNEYPVDYVTNHDDSVTFVAALLVLGCWAVVKGGRAAWSTAIFVSLYVIYAMLLNDRRIAWVELVLALVALYFLIGPGPLRRQINRWIVVTAPLVLIYVAIGLNSDAAFFEPVQALRSTGSGTDLSSLARQEEIRNLLYTLVEFGNPLFGTGWGQPYQKLTWLWSSFGETWVLADYTPHNSLLGLAVFSGLVGVFGIWGVIPVAAFLAARGYRGVTAPIPRAAAMVSVGVLVVYSVHCYGDVGFNSFTGCLFLGAALAAAGKVSVWGAAVTADNTSPAPVGTKRIRGFAPATYRDRMAERSRLFRARREPSASRDNAITKRG
jgi:hypothetical protein